MLHATWTSRFSPLLGVFSAGKMDYDQACCSLARLLCINVTTGNVDLIKKLVKKRMLKWHPDKNTENPNKYKEEFLELTEAWKAFQKGKGPDIHCYEEFDFDWDKDDGASEAEEDSDYNDSPFDDDFFHPSPKKGFAIPEDLRQFFRSSSNRRAGKCFALFCLQSDLSKLENLYTKLSHYAGTFNCFCCFNASTNKEIVVCLINYTKDHRLGDIKKETRKFDIIPCEIIYAVKYMKFFEHLNETYGEPTFKPCAPTKTKIPRPETSKFNHKALVDFAKSHQICDALELMYDYAHLAEPCDYKIEKITKEHEEDHYDQLENAYIFIHLSDRRKVAKNAIDSVFAEMYIEVKRESPLTFLDKKCKDLSDKLIDNDDIDIFGLANFYAKHHIINFKQLAKFILDSFTYGIPRNRYTILKGDFKCGKSSLAAGFNKFFDGVNININIDKGRLPFYLGNAIGKRFVLFDDVKGSVKVRGDSLYSGNGFYNLDDLRDHLDGHLEIQLEKKNQQPISQVFPPGIITCNNYEIPNSILERVQGPFKMKASKHWDKHPLHVSQETIFIACVIHNLLPASPDLHSHIQRKITDWWTKHEMCDCLNEVSHCI